MGDLINLAERTNGSLQSPVLVIIAQLVLTRTCIINILKAANSLQASALAPRPN
jgi:hypothetical protein